MLLRSSIPNEKTAALVVKTQGGSFLFLKNIFSIEAVSAVLLMLFLSV